MRMVGHIKDRVRRLCASGTQRLVIWRAEQGKPKSLQEHLRAYHLDRPNGTCRFLDLAARRYIQCPAKKMPETYREFRSLPLCGFAKGACVSAFARA